MKKRTRQAELTPSQMDELVAMQWAYSRGVSDGKWAALAAKARKVQP